MNLGTTVGSVLMQHVNQAEAAKQQLGTQSVPHQAFLEKQTQQKIQTALKEVVTKEKAERAVKRDAASRDKERRTLRYMMKGKNVTAIAEPEIDETV